MPADLQLYNSAGTALLGSLSFSATTKGTPSAAIAARFQNDGAAKAPEPAMLFFQLDADGNPVQRGLRAIEEHWLECRFLGTGSAASDQLSTGWTPVGRGRPMFAAPLSPGEYHDVEFRYNPPASASDGDVGFEVAGDETFSGNTTIRGISDHDRDGVIGGLGDDTHTELVAFGGIVENPAGADADVQVGDVIAMVEGVPVVELEHLETLDANDADSAALSSGEEYWWRISVGKTGVAVTKSVLQSIGAGDATPDLPAGHEPLGYGVRQFDAIVGNDDINAAGGALAGATIGRWGFSSSAFVATLGPGKAHIDDHLLVPQDGRNVTLPASTAGNRIWIVGDRVVTLATTTDDDAPAGRAHKVYEVDTDGTGILPATLVDLRDPIDVDTVPLVFRFSGPLTSADPIRMVWPHSRPGWIRVPRGFIFHVHDAGGSPTPNTTGEVRVDLTIDGTDAFTSKATDDRRPISSHDDASLVDTSGLAEVLEIPRYAVLVATLTVVEAYDGTAPDGAELVVMAELP